MSCIDCGTNYEMCYDCGWDVCEDCWELHQDKHIDEQEEDE